MAKYLLNGLGGLVYGATPGDLVDVDIPDPAPPPELTLTLGETAVGYSGTAAPNSPPLVTKLNSTQFLVVFGNSATGGDLNATVLTLSGSDLTAGSNVQMVNGNGAYPQGIHRISDTQALVMWRDLSSILYAMVITVSGTTPSGGTRYTLASNRGDVYAGLALFDSTYGVGCFRRSSDGYGVCKLITISGSTLSFGSEVEFNSASSWYVNAHQLSSTLAAVVYQDAGDSNQRKIVQIQRSGTTLTPQTEVNLGNTNFEKMWISPVGLYDTDKVLVYGNLGTSHRVLCAQTSGNGWSVGSSISVGSAGSFGSVQGFTDETRYGVAITRNSSSFALDATKLNVDGTTLTTDESVDLSGAQDSDGILIGAAADATHMTAVWRKRTGDAEGFASVAYLSE